jgi:hypothetical protein
MNSLERFKKWLLNRSLRQKLGSQPPVDIPKLNPARKVGILFDATSEADRNTIKSFSDKLRSRGCNVTLLGYINKKLKHNLFDFLMYHKGLINWYGEPKAQDIDRFVNNDIDILINFDTEDQMHMHFISAICRAKFKVGMSHQQEIPYQLILDSNYRDELKDVILELEIQLRKLSI